MIVTSSVYRLAPAVAACLVLIESVPLPAQSAELPESVRVALARYADLGPLAVTWTQSTEATPLGQEKLAAEVLERIIRDDTYVQQFAFRDGRIYVRRETKASSSWPPRTDEIAFDRNLFYAGTNLFYAGDLRDREPRSRPFLHKWLPQNDRPEAICFRDDYFRAAGVRVPIRMKELVLSWHPQSELLALLAEGARLEAAVPANLDGYPLIQVRVTSCQPEDRAAPRRRYDFYLDLEHGYGVRRLETRDETGRLLTRSECADFEQLNGRKLWMPRLYRVEEYTLAGAHDKENATSPIFESPLYVTTLQVNAFDAKPWPDDRFKLKYPPPGAYVNDASFPEIKSTDGVFYQVPANPQRLDEVIAARRVLYQGWISAEKRSRPLGVLFLVLNGLGLAGLAAYFFVRRKKASST